MLALDEMQFPALDLDAMKDRYPLLRNALSSEVDTGSRQENASKQESRRELAPHRVARDHHLRVTLRAFG